MPEVPVGIPVPRLEVAGLSASYGGPRVISDVSLEVKPGHLLALLGPNGAGKTTLLMSICGVTQRLSGTVSIDGKRVSGLPTHGVIRCGVAHVPQGRQLFPYMTGFENLRVGGHTRADKDGLQRDIEAFIESSPVAKRVANRQASLMSGGEQQIVAMGRALMSKPRLLLLDEPSLGLAPVLVDQVFTIISELIQNLEADGVGVILVEQTVKRALDVADEVAVLVAGKIVHYGESSKLTPEAVLDLYMGRTPGAGERPNPSLAAKRA